MILTEYIFSNHLNFCLKNKHNVKFCIEFDILIIFVIDKTINNMLLRNY
jgi:hypothetical protein